MSSATLCMLPLADLSARIRQRSLSPIELADAHLARIEQLDGELHSYLTVTAERARSDARRAEEEIARGAWRGPLHGIPIALKDLFDTAGLRTTAGSRVLRERVPARDAAVVERLAAAGAVLLGKLALHEFAMGSPRLDDFFPPARNPWDLNRIPGGSSSGSAVALAAGLCAGSLGSDTGGSIRHPAAHCAIVGLKPTYGLVSRRGATVLSWTLDHVGPMARTVEDAAIILQAIAGYDPADPASARAAIPDYRAALHGSIRGVRIGVPHAFVEATSGLEPEILGAFGAALDVLRQRGAEVRDVTFPMAEHAEAILLTILLSEAVAYHEPWLRARRHEYGRGFRERLLPGLFFTAADYVQAQRGRGLLCRGMEELMAEVDLIATPTMPRTAPTFAEEAAASPIPRSPFTRLFNITGQPSISVPGGFGRHGLPAGLMLSGRAFDEPTVLRVAAAYERATEWHGRVPPLLA